MIMILEYNVVQHQRRKFYLAPLFKFCSTDSIYDHCRLKMPCTPLNRAKCTRSSHSPPSYCLRASLIKSPHAPRNITRTRPPQPIHCFSPAAGASKNNKTLSQQPPVPGVSHIFTIDFTATFQPQFTWVGELRNFPHPSTRAHLGGGIT